MGSAQSQLESMKSKLFFMLFFFYVRWELGCLPDRFAALPYRVFEGALFLCGLRSPPHANSRAFPSEEACGILISRRRGPVHERRDGRVSAPGPLLSAPSRVNEEKYIGEHMAISVKAKP